MDVKWEQLAEDLKGEVLATLDGLVDSTAADLQEFGKAIAQDLIRAVKENREDLIHELGHQLEALAEVNRIRLVNATWAQVTKTLLTIGRVAMKVLIAAA